MSCGLKKSSSSMVYRHELIPVPRNLSSDCGMCVKLQDDIEKTLSLLDKIDMAGCYDAEGKEYLSL